MPDKFSSWWDNQDYSTKAAVVVGGSIASTGASIFLLLAAIRVIDGPAPTAGAPVAAPAPATPSLDSAPAPISTAETRAWGGQEQEALQLVRASRPKGIPGGGSVDGWFHRTAEACAVAGLRCSISSWTAVQSAGSAYRVEAVLERVLPDGKKSQTSFFWEADLRSGEVRLIK